jgi:hypothetical protein
MRFYVGTRVGRHLWMGTSLRPEEAVAVGIGLGALILGATVLLGVEGGALVALSIVLGSLAHLCGLSDGWSGLLVLAAWVILNAGLIIWAAKRHTDKAKARAELAAQQRQAQERYWQEARSRAEEERKQSYQQATASIEQARQRNFTRMKAEGGHAAMMAKVMEEELARRKDRS